MGFNLRDDNALITSLRAPFVLLPCPGSYIGVRKSNQGLSIFDDNSLLHAYSGTSLLAQSMYYDILSTSGLGCADIASSYTSLRIYGTLVPHISCSNDACSLM